MSRLSASSPPELLLTPSAEVLPQGPKKSISSGGGRNSYFMSGSSHHSLSPALSPHDEVLSLSRRSICRASSSYASDSGSDYVSNSGESAYLTPPQSQGDNDKAPYKSRSLSSSSLNMISDRGKRHLKQNENLEEDNENGLDRDPQRIERFNDEDSPLDERKATVGHVSDKTIRRTAAVPNRIIDLRHIENDTQLTSTTAANTTTRRWSSAGIGSCSSPRRASFGTNPLINYLNSGHCKRTNSQIKTLENYEITKLVRNRLMSHKVTADQQSTPATIALRRAGGLPSDRNLTSAVNLGGCLEQPTMSRSKSGDQKRSSISKYLITTEDINFITSLIHFGFRMGRITVHVTDGDLTRSPRKPSVTSQGVAVESSTLENLATTTTDVQQFLELSHIFSSDQNFSVTRPSKLGTKEESPTLSLEDVSEIIWKDTRLRGDWRSSEENSSPIEQGEYINDSGVTWAPSHSFSAEQGSKLPHEKYPVDFQRKTPDGEHSPTHRVCQWVFKDSANELVTSPGPSTNRAKTENNPESPTTFVERKSFPIAALVTPEVISFPALSSRNSTSDWITPLPDLNVPRSDDDKSLYESKIDADDGQDLSD